MKTDFGTARFVASVLEILGWLAVVGGVIVVVMGFDARNGLPLIATGIGAVIAGVFQVAGAQLIRAQVVTAENSGETVALLRQIAAGTSASGARAAPAPAPEIEAQARQRAPGLSTQPPGSRVKTYKGREILRAEIGFSVDGVGRYPTVIAAERFIDGKA